MSNLFENRRLCGREDGTACKSIVLGRGGEGDQRLLKKGMGKDALVFQKIPVQSSPV